MDALLVFVFWLGCALFFAAIPFLVAKWLRLLRG